MKEKRENCKEKKEVEMSFLSHDKKEIYFRYKHGIARYEGRIVKQTLNINSEKKSELKYKLSNYLFIF